MNLRVSVVILVTLLAVLLLGGLLRPAEAPGGTEVVVFAAASLTDAFNEIAAAFEAAHPGVTVTLQFAGSSTLAAQIASGAKADVFASANERQMGVVAEAGLAAGEPLPFAHNRLVLAVPADNPAGIRDLHDLARPGVLLVVAAPDVPVRAYTDEMLAALAADPAYGEAFRTAVLANIASEEINVRQVVAKVALGEADAGIVYASDVPPTASDARALPIPEAANPLATYPIAVLAGSRHPDEAAAFVAFVRSGDGQAILARWGFLPLAG